MKGLELAEKFYNEFGQEMLNQDFAHLKKYLAVGLVGSGSECFGFDDDISRDHDFEPAFCIFLPDEDLISSQDEFLLKRAYCKLPKEFMDNSRNLINPVGGSRHGVIRISDFFESKVGDKKGDISLDAWFFISEQFLLEATNGKIFEDNLGLITEIRQKLAYLPEDVRLKKLAGNLLLMAQSGLYNYNRCIKRGETGAAQLAISEFVNAALKAIFLINRQYIPYYKWVFKALRALPKLSHLQGDLEFLISSGNDSQTAKTKVELIEKISQEIANELKVQDLIGTATLNLENTAYQVNDKIKSAEIRNLNVLYAV